MTKMHDRSALMSKLIMAMNDIIGLVVSTLALSVALTLLNLVQGGNRRRSLLRSSWHSFSLHSLGAICH